MFARLLAPLIFVSACGGSDCPAGFLQDNDGNCIQAEGGGSKGGGGGGGGGGGQTGGGQTGGGSNGGGGGGGSNGGGSNGGGSTGDIYAINDTDWDIGEIYVSECGASSWGANQMSGILEPGDVWTVRNVPNGCYDLQAWSWNGAAVWETFGVDIEGDFDWTLY